MPQTLYWAGSTAAAGLNRFNFNYGPNWKVWNWNKPYTQWATSNTGPQGTDTIVIGQYFVAASPVLYGGYSGGVSSGTWAINGGTAGSASGTTANTGLLSFQAELSMTSASSNTMYPFPYLGGGITGDAYNYVVNVMGQDMTDFTGSTAYISGLGLNLKVNYNTTINTTGRINPFYEIGGVDGNGYPNYNVVDLNFVGAKVGSATGAGSCSTSLYCSSSLAPAYGFGNLTVRGGLFNSVSINANMSYGGNQPVARPMNLQFYRTLVGNANIISSDLYIDKSCTFGTLSIPAGENPYLRTLGPRRTGYDGHGIKIAGYFDTPTALVALGYNSPSVTASPFYSGVYLYPQRTSRPAESVYNYFPIVYVSNPDDGVTFTSQVFNVVTAGGLSGTVSGAILLPWDVRFYGDTTIQTMTVQNANIGAAPGLGNNKRVSITNITLAENSALDLQQAHDFDNWSFGSVTGGNVIGGINFADDTGVIRGSAGVRLYNTQMINNFFDNRAGNYVTDVSSNLTQYVGGAGPATPVPGG